MGVAYLPHELYGAAAHDDNAKFAAVQMVPSVAVAGHHQQREGLRGKNTQSMHQQTHKDLARNVPERNRHHMACKVESLHISTSSIASKTSIFLPH